jgi:putative FmdB family regulatory protein
MPLYEYQCEACEHRFEKIQKYTDPAPEACPKCGGTVRKLASSPAIQFKGTGWYITDYAKKSGSESGKSAGGKSDGGEKSDGGAKTDSSSDTSSSSEKSDKSGTSDKSKSAETTAAKTDTPAAPKTT